VPDGNEQMLAGSVRVGSGRVGRVEWMSRGTVSAMPAAGNDFGLEDEQLRLEIELLGMLIAAAADRPDRLSEQEIDEVLGARPPESPPESE
jgi:hypothetical protein